MASDWKVREWWGEACLSLHDSLADDVLRGDHLKLVLLAQQLAVHRSSDLRIRSRKRRREEVWVRVSGEWDRKRVMLRARSRCSHEPGDADTGHTLHTLHT